MSTREKILDAAARVMRERGLAAATTKEIARAAGYSEATLYKNFADKQEIFVYVMRERMPTLDSSEDLAGHATVAANITRLVVQLLRFYVRTFPIAASIFATPALLEAQRTGVHAHGGGPQEPLERMRRYLVAEQVDGRIGKGADTLAVARLLVGASMQQAFLASFESLDHVPDEDALASSLVAPILPALGIT